MKSFRRWAAVAFMLGASVPAIAQVDCNAVGEAVDAFVALPTSGVGLQLRRSGTQNPLTDPLRLITGAVTGIESTNPLRQLYAPPARLTLLESRTTDVVYQGQVHGTLTDYVLRDACFQNQIVLGLRVVLSQLVNGQPNILEINDFYRSGFTGYSAAVGWAFASDIDLRLYSAARSPTPLLGGTDVFDPDTVNMKSDINPSEGNPRSGYFFVRTDAPSYRLTTEAEAVAPPDPPPSGQPYNPAPCKGLVLRQSGEEGQPVTSLCYRAFVPAAAAPPETVPVPIWALALLGAILGTLGMRRMNRGAQSR